MLTVLLAVVMVLLCACGTNGDDNETQLKETKPDETEHGETREETEPVYLLVKETVFRNGYEYSVKEYEYDEQGNLYSSINWVPEPHIYFKEMFNTEGKCIEYSTYHLISAENPEGLLSDQILYTYNEDGTLCKQENKSRTFSWSESEGEKLGEWSVYITEYDHRYDNGILAESKAYANGELVLYIKYDKNSRKSMQYKGGELYFLEENEYIPNSQDYKITYREYYLDRGVIISKLQYVYDSDGKLILTIETQRDSGDTILDEYVTEYEYELLGK